MGLAGRTRLAISGLATLAWVLGIGMPAAAVGESARKPKPAKVVSVLDKACQAKHLNKVVKDRSGRPLICIQDWTQRTWRPAPDAVATAAHAGFRQYLTDLQATVPPSTADLRVIKEPGFPDDLANAMLAGIRVASTVYGANENSAFIMAITPEFMYSTARSLAEPCWNTADAESKGTWLMENVLEVRAQQYEGYGHAGLCDNVFFAYFNSRKPESLANASPMSATEGIVREYLINSPSLEPQRFRWGPDRRAGRQSRERGTSRGRSWSARKPRASRIRAAGRTG